MRKVLAVSVLVVISVLWSAPGAWASVQYRYCKPAASEWNSVLKTDYILGVYDVKITNVNGSNAYALSTHKVSYGDDKRGTVASVSGNSSVSLTADRFFWKADRPWTRMTSTYKGTSCTVTFRPV